MTKLSVGALDEYFGVPGVRRGEDPSYMEWVVVNPLSGVIRLRLFGDGGVLLDWSYLGVSPSQEEVLGLVGALQGIEGQKGR